jgi:hypothetical protein
VKILLGLQITTNCVRRTSFLTECIPRSVIHRRVTDTVLGKKESTHSVTYRAERGPTMTERDGTVECVECVPYVHKSTEDPVHKTGLE